MGSRQQTITGELRKWRLEYDRDGNIVVIGNMYNDVHQIWEDGEPAVIHCIDWVESVNFYLAATANGAIKCPKNDRDTRFPNAIKIFNSKDTPEKG